jgi:type VI secretion system secreted protein Hcp
MATDYFLKIDGIDGESQDAKFKGAIQLESWSWGASNAATFGAGSGGGAGKVSMQDFHFTMTTSKASPNLMLACSSGKHIEKAQLSARKAGTEQNEYLTFKFTKVIVSSYSIGGMGGGGELPTDQISLAFEKVEWIYQQQDAKGAVGSPVKGGWDLAKNAKV